jgi:hypothetical protein
MLGLPLGKRDLPGLVEAPVLAVAPAGGLRVAPALRDGRVLTLARGLLLAALVALMQALAHELRVRAPLELAVPVAAPLLLAMAEWGALAVPAPEVVAPRESLLHLLPLGTRLPLAEGQGRAVLLACALPLAPPPPLPLLPETLEVTLGEASVEGEGVKLSEAPALAQALLLAPPSEVGLTLLLLQTLAAALRVLKGEALALSETLLQALGGALEERAAPALPLAPLTLAVNAPGVALVLALVLTLGEAAALALGNAL